MQVKEKSLQNEITDALNKIKNATGNEFYGYSVTCNHSQSLQTLFLGLNDGDLLSYQNRTTEEQSCRVQIYTRTGNPVMMGSFGFVVDPFFPIEDQITKGYLNARVSKNEVWDLVNPPLSPYEDILTCDPGMEKDMAGAQASLIDEVKKAIGELKGVRVNSAELYLNYHDIRTETSTGVVMNRRKTDIYFEAAMEKRAGFNTQEVHRYLKGTSLEQMRIKKFLEEMALETESLGDAELPKTNENAVLIVNGDVISDFVHELVDQLGADNEYQKLTCMKPGDSVYEEKLSGSDPLTIKMDPHIPYMSESSPFTHEGIPSESAILIEDGKVLEQIVSSRMGQYLSKKHNGICGNFVMQPGNMSREDLIASVDECIEILTFSSLLINPRTLTWSSEIKLGRLHRKGLAPVMVKGGVASGNIRENFAGCKFGNELITISAPADQWHPSKGYIGPDSMLIRSGVKIAGE